MAKRKGISRRCFIGSVGGAAAGIGLGLRAAPAVGRALGANEGLLLGVIGTGGRGRMLMRVFRRNPEVRFAAVCDVFPPSLEAGAGEAGGPVEKYVDYRRLLDRGEIDAVIIATPEHQHAAPMIDAVRAGKDVYLEKPLSHTIEEGLAMVKAARLAGRIVQVGMQQRSAPHFQEARDIVLSGRLGDIHLVESYWYQNFTGAVNQSFPVPEGLDWGRFLGPAPWRALEGAPWRFWEWRYYWDYSGGALCDNGTHVFDWVHMLMGDRSAPLSATCSGGSRVIKRWETPDVFSAVLEYENGWLSTLTFNYTEDFGLGHFHGSRFHGTEGLLEISRDGWALYARGSGKPEQERKNRGMDVHHVRNFLDCVRTRELPNGDVLIGYQGVRSPHLANIAYREGRKVRFDPDTESVLGS